MEGTQTPNQRESVVQQREATREATHRWRRCNGVLCVSVSCLRSSFFFFLLLRVLSNNYSTVVLKNQTLSRSLCFSLGGEDHKGSEGRGGPS